VLCRRNTGENIVKKLELRHVELRADGGQVADAQMTLRGRAVTYNSLSKPMPSQRGFTFRERVLPLAFSKSLESASDVLCTLNHQTNAIPLGRTSAGTLQLSDGPQGLDFVVQLDKNNSEHRNLWSACKRGDISQCSWGFNTDDDGWDDGDADCTDDDGNRCARRTIRSAKLFSVDVVNSPAYNETSVQARSFANRLFLTGPQGEILFPTHNRTVLRQPSSTKTVDAALEAQKQTAHRQYQAINADFRAAGLSVKPADRAREREAARERIKSVVERIREVAEKEMP
jgi:HK97 family phage prohead protease